MQQIPVLNPYTGQEMAKITASDAQAVDAAVAKAQEAFLTWSQKPIKERCQVLLAMRQGLLNQLDDIATVISSESGKTIAEAQAGLMKGIEVLEYASSLQNMDHGGRMEVSRGVYCEYRREPLGVVAGITPFNFPAMVPMWMIPIAIGLGNSFIWKPSEKTPLTPPIMLDVFEQAGLPKGVLSVVNGDKETVQEVLKHRDIKAIGFVGSTAVAKIIYQTAAQYGKRVLALGGAKNHIILMPDADVELSGQGISSSYTGCAGQRCMAASVLVAVGETDKHIEAVVNASKKIKLGVDMGAIISKESLLKLEKAIEQAEKDGAKVILDGRDALVPDEYSNGYWLGPTILDNVKPDSQAATEELFGPVLSIIRAKNLSEALEIENKNPYGNACSVFTDSGTVAERVSREAKAGMIGVNIGVPVPREPFSFGGFYESKFGHGDITGESSLNFWSAQKKITVKWQKQKDQNWMS